MSVQHDLVLINDICAMELCEDGIVEVKAAHIFEDHIQIGIDFIDELTRLLDQLTNGVPHPVMFNLDDRYVDIPREVRQYIAQHKRLNELKLAEAIVTRSMASALIANAYLTINKPPIPARLCTDEAKARKWLKKFQK
ncbi:MAG: hypothetical protein KDD54_14525 [Flavobacteriales bacterium]|nr:hypothetical protein [Flavobacteriales bacterium]